MKDTARVERRDGYRYSTAVMDRTLAKSASPDVTSDRLFNAAKLVDNGDKYLNAKELGRALDAITPPAGASHEKLMGLDPAAFEAAAREDLAAPKKTQIPQVAALDFANAKRAGGVSPSEMAKVRDERSDQLAHRVAEKLNEMRYWRAEVIGGDAAKADVLGGALPQEYPMKNGREYGEAYNLINVHVPRVGDETFAIVWKRLFNSFELDGRPAEYVQEQPEMMLAFVKEGTLKLLGSGYGIDEGLFTETKPSRVAAKIEQLADDILATLEEFKALNDGRRGGGGVG